MPLGTTKRLILVKVLGVAALVLCIGGVIWATVDTFADEGRDFALMAQLHSLGQELKQFKQDNGHYPDAITDIRTSDQLCVNHFFEKCSQVHYKPTADLQDFRMALKAFSWSILFYHPYYSMTTDEYEQLSKEEIDKRFEEDTTTCFNCIAFPQGSKINTENEDYVLIYRETSPVFSNPDEWPVLW